MIKSKSRSSKQQRARRAGEKIAAAKIKAGGIVAQMIPRLRRLANSLHKIERHRKIQANRVEAKLRAEFDKMVTVEFPSHVLTPETSNEQAHEIDSAVGA